jgi:hypothetical protein
MQEVGAHQEESQPVVASGRVSIIDSLMVAGQHARAGLGGPARAGQNENHRQTGPKKQLDPDYRHLHSLVQDADLSPIQALRIFSMVPPVGQHRAREAGGQSGATGQVAYACTTHPLITRG